MRQNPSLDAEQVIQELGVGEALVSLLDAKGTPGIVQKALVVPPAVRLGPATPQERAACLASSEVAGAYEKRVDRESAYEMLQAAASDVAAPPTASGRTVAVPAPAGENRSVLSEVLLGSTGSRGGRKEGLLEVAAKSALRSVGSSVGRQLVRGLLGTLLGGSNRRRG